MNIRTAAFKILLQLHLKPALTQTGRRGGDPGGRRGRRWQQGSQVETNFFFREFYKSLGLSSFSPYQSRSGSPLLTWQLPGWNSIAEAEVIAKNIHSPIFWEGYSNCMSPGRSMASQSSMASQRLGSPPPSPPQTKAIFFLQYGMTLSPCWHSSL